MSGFVTPAKAGVQRERYPLDSGLCRNDEVMCRNDGKGQACLRRNDEGTETRV